MQNATLPSLALVKLNLVYDSEANIGELNPFD